MKSRVRRVGEPRVQETRKGSLRETRKNLPRLSQSIRRIENRDGKLNVVGLGAWYRYWRDPYHLMLTIPWLGFVALVSLAYIFINMIFALLFLAGGDCIVGAEPGNFWDAFFFSVQTLGSIGYGVMSPGTRYAHVIVTAEAIASLLAIAVVTGLAFARFAKPTARIMFSKVAVIERYNGVPTLTFRAANQRHNQIVEAHTRVYLMQDEKTQEGNFLRRFHELKLTRHRTPSFTLSWNVMHPINEDSPLYGQTLESLEKSRAQIAVSISGTDETVAYNIHARHMFSPCEILWDHQFVDLFYQSSNGDRYLDYTHFHETVPLESTPSFLEQPFEQTG
ncbi:MAG: ATP-sensitive inward rectifier potassium channel 10 [Timaviella obliquedivisa GSE-PSE-MK23-08B]|nr:ATP-sensitive inward rectifier potassium channel 10 [Timaviella obliquedivisa GSE-PSE-MK23-08B]